MQPPNLKTPENHQKPQKSENRKYTKVHLRLWFESINLRSKLRVFCENAQKIVKTRKTLKNSDFGALDKKPKITLWRKVFASEASSSRSDESVTTR